jgi:hypothetical protein
MKEFEFTLKFSLQNSTQDPQDYIEALGEAGCDDAIIGLAQKGRIALQFTRAADDAFSAVTSAIQNVKSAIPDAKLIESTPDLVGLSDIAKLMGVSRQYLQKLESTKHNFPEPIHRGKFAIWHLSSFLNWYEVTQRQRVDKATKEIASANMQINIAREWAQLDHQTQSRISSLVF